MHLTWRWTRLRPHAIQREFAASRARFAVVSAGRRSGKTEIAKRKLVFRALNAHRQDLPDLYVPFADPRFLIAAPTVEQAKTIYWEDIKALIPANFFWGRPNESMLSIRLINNARIRVTGMDKPARAEGTPWDGIVLDEFADMKPDVFSSHLEPALAERRGWCWFVGVPEGRNHYYTKWREARAEEEKAKAEGREAEWATFTWLSADILDPREIARLRATVDEVTFNREYCGSWEAFSNRVYYAFDDRVHCAALTYDRTAPLEICFDFNISPGIAVICQEQVLPNGEKGTGIIGEVWIERNSNTPLVMSKLLTDWSEHVGVFNCYGDPAGYAGGTMRLESDWEMIKRLFHRGLGSLSRVAFDVPKCAPRERDRVNAMNSRLRAADGTIRMMIDPRRAPHVIEDLDNTLTVKGGSGEIDKKSNARYSHLCFAGGTLVETPDRGVIEIARLAPRGRVRGDDGSWVEYERAGKTIEDAAMVDVTLSTGEVIRCTPWHKFLTDFGWRRAVCLLDRQLVSWSATAACKRDTTRGVDAYRASIVDYAASSDGVCVRSVTAAPRADAYCLLVPNRGCFALASGHVVANSDAIGYYVTRRFPVGREYVKTGQKHWK